MAIPDVKMWLIKLRFHASYTHSDLNREGQERKQKHLLLPQMKDVLMVIFDFVPTNYKKKWKYINIYIHKTYNIYL